jgi:P-type conjugative transfer protein TrbG
MLGIALALAVTFAATDGQIARANGSGAVIAPDGSTRYPYGRYEPTLVCQPLFVCDLILEQGESVLNIAVGDSVRWVIASAQSGPSGSTPHVFLKPTRANLITNLVVTTTKRVYYVHLVSASNAPNPRLSFSYPDEEAAAEAEREKSAQEQDTDAPELPLLPANQLDAKYRMVGAPEIMPSRVYNVAQDGSQQIVNFRLRDRTFVIDGIQSGFNLVLNGGTGHHGHGQRTVYIRHM